MKKINFYAGPAILPREVIDEAQQAVKEFAGMGLSILEISHRSKQFVAVMEEARALVKELMQLDNKHEVIFLHGGALSQFHMAPMNLLNVDETASYFDTGTWAHGALVEAGNFGHVHIACSSKDKNYNYIPGEYAVPAHSKYLHFTSNNTIYGTQLHGNKIPDGSRGGWLVCDMSSDILSRQMDFNRFDLIYAGAQKNVGAAGVTMVIINKEILGTANRPIPRMLDYRLHIEKESMLNTPAVFAVYVSLLTLRWVKKRGLGNIEKANISKAEKLYNAIDSSSLFKGLVAKEDRSLMNVCYTAGSKELDDKFVAFAEQQNIVGIKGHRTVGGLRASIYNAMDESGVEVLVEVMRAFERTL